MSSSKQHVTIGDLVDKGLATIQTGPFGTQLKASEYTDHGVPVVNVRNLGNGVLREAQLERVPEDVSERLSSHILEEKDIVFGRKGAVDRHVLVAAAQAGWMQGSDCIRLRLFPGSPLRSEFLSKILMTDPHKRWMEAQCSHGATMASLNQDIIRRIDVVLPTDPVQRRITAVLSVFDELIEINERRIELLGEVAQALFNEWFVRFRFPGHETIGLIDSEMGLIPKGWQVCALGDIADLEYGKALPKRMRHPGNVAVVSSAGIIDTHDEALVSGPGIVIGRKGNVGSVWWVNQSFFPIDTTYYVNSGVSLEFLYWRLREAEFIDSHAAVPGLNRNQANALRMVVPPVDHLRRFSEVSGPLLTRVASSRDAIRRLRDTRDLLLPRLVSGQLDISDIDLGILTPVEG